MRTPDHIKDYLYEDLTNKLESKDVRVYQYVNDLIQIQRNELIAHQNELLKQLIDVLTPNQKHDPSFLSDFYKSQL